MSPSSVLPYTSDESPPDCVLDDDVVEIPLLLSGRQVEALEKQAHKQGLTAGEMLRQLVNNFLANQQRRSR